MECAGSFEIYETVGRLNCFQNALNVTSIQFKKRNNEEFDILITFENSSCFIFSTFKLPKIKGNSFSDNTKLHFKNKASFKVINWKTVVLPFRLKDITCSSKNILILSKEFCFDINPYLVKNIQSKESLYKDEDAMECDESYEYQPDDFQLIVNSKSLTSKKLLDVKCFIRSNLCNHSVIIARKNVQLAQLDLSLMFTNDILHSADTKLFALASLPLSAVRSHEVVDGEDGSAFTKPVIKFVVNDVSTQHSRQKKSLLDQMLCLDILFSANCCCFIGCSDGKVYYLLCSWLSEIDNCFSSSHLEEFYDMKQPIVDVRYLQNVKYCEGNSIILFIGAFGKLVFLSAENVFEKSIARNMKGLSFYERTLYLSSDVEKCISLEKSFLHCSSRGDLWMSGLQVAKNAANKLSLSIENKQIVMRSVKDVVLLNEKTGYLLVLTQSGVLYLCKYTEGKDGELSISKPLQILMNEAINQSAVLKDLNTVKSLQSKFFDAVSKFAAIKFNGVKESLICTVTELDIPPKRILINVHLERLKQFITAPEFWYVTANLHSCFKKEFTGISKTMPLTMGSNLCFEIELSRICPSHSSPYPLYLEMGLTLTLPDEYKLMECFKLSSMMLPLFVRVQTFILNEMHLLKPESEVELERNHFLSSLEITRTAFDDLKAMAIDRPISHFLGIKSPFPTDFPNEFTFRLLSSSIQNIVQKDQMGSTLSQRLHQIISQKYSADPMLSDCRLICSSKKEIANLVISSLNSDTLSLTLNSESFFLLVGLRMAILEFLMNNQKKSKAQERKYISIPASVSKECEVMSNELLGLFGKDVNDKEFFSKIVSVYKRLRKRVSEMIPFY